MLADLIAKLQKMLDDAKPIPLTAQVRIDAEDFRAVLDQMRTELPPIEQLYRDLDALLVSLAGPLSEEDRASGWTDENRDWWLDYFSNMKTELLAGKPQPDAAHHLVRWLDYYGTTGGALSDRIAKLQPKLWPYR